MVIRQETPQDWRETENLTREAFWNVYRPGCMEHFILHRFRERPDFIPALDLVMEDAGEIVAHIMYCRAPYGTDDGREVPTVLFGPVSVRPDRQGLGLGSRLIRYSLERAKELGCGAVAITGNPAFYHRVGFVFGASRGVYYAGMDRGEEAPFFMIKELIPGFLPDVPGTFSEPDGYQVDPAELEAFDRLFPPKVKERRPGQLDGQGEASH